jgi:hypothetical protein
VRHTNSAVNELHVIVKEPSLRSVVDTVSKMCITRSLKIKLHSKLSRRREESRNGFLVDITLNHVSKLPLETTIDYTTGSIFYVDRYTILQIGTRGPNVTLMNTNWTGRWIQTATKLSAS